MRIAFVSQVLDGVLPPKQNSIGLWTCEAAQRLGQRHEVIVIARRRPGSPARVSSGTITVQFVRCLSPRAWVALGRARARLSSAAVPLFAHAYYAKDYVRQSIRRLRAFEPDIVHIQNFPNHLPAYRRAFPRAVLVLHMHCDWLVELDRGMTERNLAAADLVVGCSRHVADGARARFGHMPLRFAELPNGTKTAAGADAAVKREGDLVLFVGRVSPEKGVHVLLEAWPEIRSARPHAALRIVGSPGVCPRDLLVDLSSDADVRALSRFYVDVDGRSVNYSRLLREMIPADLKESVTFAGFQPHERVLADLASAALLVNPSLSESFGMSVIEALAFGTPVVASRVGGMPEVIEATAGGVLVDKGNPRALAKAVINLLEDREHREAMGQRGTARVVELYSWERVAARAETLYRQVLDTRS